MTAAPATTTRLERVRAWAIGLSPRTVAIYVFAGIAVIGVLGAIERAGAPLGLFDLDGEGNPPAAYSAFLLLSAGALAALVGTLPAESEWRRRWYALGAFLAFMGFDEAITFHEKLQDALEYDWQKMYLPIAALGGIAWLLVFRRLASREQRLFALGAAAWVIAQIDEYFQANPDEGRVSGYGSLATIEEVLELIGSALFLLALLEALRRVAEARSRRSAA